MMDDFQGLRFVACRLEKGARGTGHHPASTMAALILVLRLFFFLFIALAIALLRKWD